MLEVRLGHTANFASYIFQDLITGGDLFSFLERKNGKLSEVEAAVIVRQIVIALEYLHEQNVVHRDLKPENILMTSLANGCRVVLTDFGHSKKVENDRTRMTTMAGTEQYIAPLVLLDSPLPMANTIIVRFLDLAGTSKARTVTPKLSICGPWVVSLLCC